MAKPQTIIRDGSGTRTATYQLPPGLFQYIESILVELDNGAAVAVRPTLKVETVNGRVMATKRQGESVPAGDTGTATWALRLTDELGGVILFDVENFGDWLYIETTGTHGGRGMVFDAEQGEIRFDVENFGDWLYIETTGTHGGRGMVFDAEQGEIRFFVDDAATGAFRVDAPFIRLDTSGVSFRLLDSGETFFECDGGASWFFDDFALAVNGNVTSGDITFTLGAITGSFTIQDHNGNPIFRVDEDGDLHGLTGKALVFDL